MTSIRLGYRILELPQGSRDLANDGVEKARYFQVERAMEDMRQEFRRRTQPPNWYLVAPNQDVLLSPDDFVE